MPERLFAFDVDGEVLEVPASQLDLFKKDAEERGIADRVSPVETFDVDGETFDVRPTDVGAFLKANPKASRAFLVDDTSGGAFSVREQDRDAWINSIGDEEARNKMAEQLYFDSELPRQSSRLGRVAKLIPDAGLAFAKGTAKIPEAVAGLVDLATAKPQMAISWLATGKARTGYYGKLQKAAMDAVGLNTDVAAGFYADAMSDDQKAAIKQVDDATGFVDTAMAYIENPSVALMQAAESLPLMLVTRGATGAAMKSGAIASRFAPGTIAAAAEGALSAGSIQEEMRRGSDEGLTTGRQAGMAALAGVGVAAVGAASNKLGARLGIEDIEVPTAKKAMLEQVVKERAKQLPYAVRLAAATLKEGLVEEGGQTFVEATATNIGEGKPIMEGVGKQVAGGIAAGGAMGFAANIKPQTSANAKADAAIRSTLEDFGADAQDIDALSEGDRKRVQAALVAGLDAEMAHKLIKTNEGITLYDKLAGRWGYNFKNAQEGIAPNFNPPMIEGPDGKPVPNWTSFGGDGRSIEDLESGIAITQDGKGEITVWNRKANQSVPAESEQEAVELAKNMSVYNQAVERSREKKLGFLSDAAARLAGKVEFQAFNTFDELMAAHGEEIEGASKNTGGVKLADGTVAVVLDNIGSPYEMLETVLHEAGVHVGIREVFQDKTARDEFLGKIDKQEIAPALAHVKKLGYDTSSVAGIEEALAYMYEKRTVNPTTYQRGVAALHDQLRKLFPKMQLSRSDIEVIMSRAQRQVRGEGGIVENRGGTAPQVAPEAVAAQPGTEQGPQGENAQGETLEGPQAAPANVVTPSADGKSQRVTLMPEGVAGQGEPVASAVGQDEVGEASPDVPQTVTPEPAATTPTAEPAQAIAPVEQPAPVVPDAPDVVVPDAPVAPAKPVTQAKPVPPKQEAKTAPQVKRERTKAKVVANPMSLTAENVDDYSNPALKQAVKKLKAWRQDEKRKLNATKVKQIEDILEVTQDAIERKGKRSKAQQESWRSVVREGTRGSLRDYLDTLGEQGSPILSRLSEGPEFYMPADIGEVLMEDGTYNTKQGEGFDQLQYLNDEQKALLFKPNRPAGNLGGMDAIQEFWSNLDKDASFVYGDRQMDLQSFFDQFQNEYDMFKSWQAEQRDLAKKIRNAETPRQAERVKQYREMVNMGGKKTAEEFLEIDEYNEAAESEWQDVPPDAFDDVFVASAKEAMLQQIDEDFSELAAFPEEVGDIVTLAGVEFTVVSVQGDGTMAFSNEDGTIVVRQSIETGGFEYVNRDQGEARQDVVRAREAVARDAQRDAGEAGKADAGAGAEAAAAPDATQPAAPEALTLSSLTAKEITAQKEAEAVRAEEKRIEQEKADYIRARQNAPLGVGDGGKGVLKMNQDMLVPGVTSDTPLFDQSWGKQAAAKKQPATPAAAVGSQQAAPHVAVYNGTEVEVDDFKQAAMRVAGNLQTGEHGYVKTPDGKLYEIVSNQKGATLVKAMRTKAERNIAELEARIPKAKSDSEREVLSKRLAEMKAKGAKPAPDGGVKQGYGRQVDQWAKDVGKGFIEKIEKRLDDIGEARFRIASHGTGSLFLPEQGYPYGRFRLDFVRTGEAATNQGYLLAGHGVYFAGRPSTSEYYYNLLKRETRWAYSYFLKDGTKLSQDTMVNSVLSETLIDVENGAMADGSTFDDVLHRNIDKHESALDGAPENLKGLESFFIDKAKGLLGQINAVEDPGAFMWEVDLPDSDIAKMMQWRHPYSAQPENVKKAFRDAQSELLTDDDFLLAPGSGVQEFIPDNMLTGEWLYNKIAEKLGGEAQASEWFASRDVPGNAHEDGTTRKGLDDGGVPDYNYVVWDQGVLDKTTMLKRNGKALKAAQVVKAVAEAKAEYARPDGDTRYREAGEGMAVTPEHDATYMAAVEAGDESAASEIVRSAAKKAMPNVFKDDSGEPTILYHGSNTFGNTVFNKKPMMFTTTSSQRASGYGGPGFGTSRGLSRNRNIEPFETVDERTSTDKIVSKSKSVLGENVHKMSQAERLSLFDKYKAKFDNFNKRMSALDLGLVNYSEMTEDQREFLGNAQYFAYMFNYDAGDWMALRSSVEDGGPAGERVLLNWIDEHKGIHEDYSKLRSEYYNDRRPSMSEGEQKYFDGIFDGYDTGDTLIEAESSFSNLLDKNNDIVEEDGSVPKKTNVVNAINERAGSGIYSFYVDAGTNPLVVDAKGAFWTSIEFNGKKMDTDSIGEFAKANGYTSVRIDNVVDPGVQNSEGSNIITFSPSQVKSADPVTYDDAGNVIPPSERFNPKNDDVRYRESDAGQEMRFSELSGDLQARVDAAQGRDAKQAVLDAWKAENPERYAELEKMRADVLKKAGYNVGPVWHGTAPMGWRWERGGVVFDDPAIITPRIPMYFAENKSYAQAFAQLQANVRALGNNARVLGAFVRMANPYMPESRSYWKSLRANTFDEVSRLQNAGYDGVVMRETPEGRADIDGLVYVPFSPSQIKSADPIALDAAGRLIPPSEWAKADNPDVRYRLAGQSLDEPTRNSFFGMISALAGTPEDGSLNIADTVRKKTQDFRLPIRRMYEQIMKRPGATFDRETMEYTFNAERRRSLFSIKREEMSGEFVAPILTDLKTGSWAVDDLDRYAQALHAPYYNRMVADRRDGTVAPGAMADDLFAAIEEDGWAGKGLADSRAEQIVANYNRRTNGNLLKRAAEKLVAMNRKVLDQRVADGLMSKEQADLWKRLSPYYVPLKVLDAQDGAVGVGGKNLAAKESKRAIGHFGKENASSFINSLVQMDAAINRGLANKERQNLWRFLQANPDASRYVLRDTIPSREKTTGRYADGTLAVTTVPDMMYLQKDGVVPVKFEGVVKYIEFIGPSGAAIGKAVKETTLKGRDFEAAMRPVMHFFKWMRTMGVLDFALRNGQNDAVDAFSNMAAEGYTKEAAMAAKIVPSAWKMLVQHERGKAVTGPYAKYYEEYKKSGSQMANKWVDATGKTWAREIELSLGIDSDPKAVKLAKSIIDNIEKLNTVVEIGTRFSVYTALRESGKSVSEAAEYARNITVDFERKGEWTPILNTLWAFSNVAIQGNARFIRAIVKGKHGRRFVGAVLASAFLNATLNMMLSEPDDDDDEDEYMKIRDHIKSQRILLHIPGTKKYATIRARGLPGWLWWQGTALAEATFGRRSWGSFSSQMPVTLFETLNPIGQGEGITLTATPSLAAPFVQQDINKKWTGQPLVPGKDSPWMKNAPRSTLAYESTPQMYKATAKYLNAMTGGDAVTSGKVDVSPEIIKHWVDFAVGSFPALATRSLDTTLRLARGEDIPVNSVPVLRDFMVDAEDFKQNTRYYEAIDEFENSMYRLKNYEKYEERQRLYKEKPYLRSRETIKAKINEIRKLEDEAAKLQLKGIDTPLAEKEIEKKQRALSDIVLGKR